MRPQDFDPQKIVDTLQGQCMESLQSAIEHHYPEMSEDDLTLDDHYFIDNEIFECSQCGWWCEISEESGVDEDEMICNNCAEEEN